MTNRHSMLHLASLGCVALVSTAGCQHAETTAAAVASPSAPAVNIVRATRGEIDRRITVPATIRPNEQAVLYAKVAGYLKTIRVDRGDAVRRGDLIAEIESPELAADLARQKAEVAVADIAYRRARDAQQKAPDLVMPQTVDDAKGKLDVAQASLERTQTLLSYTEIRAPLTGIVTKRTVDPGAFIPAATSGSVTQNAALVTIMDLRSVRIEIPVPEQDVPFVKAGLPVEVVVDELPGHTFQGRITRFAYALDDASKTMIAEAEIPNSQLELRPGMYARVRLTLERKADALLIPTAALMGKAQDSVLTIEDGKAKRLRVKAGFRDDSKSEIVDGLQPEQPVIVPGPNPPAEGQAVRVEETK